MHTLVFLNKVKIDVINARPACAWGLQCSVWLSVRLSVTSLLVSFDICSVSFNVLFTSYFVVSSPDEQLRILLVAITVTWSVTPSVSFLPTQQIRLIMNSAAAQLPSGPSD